MLQHSLDKEGEDLVPVDECTADDDADVSVEGRLSGETDPDRSLTGAWRLELSTEELWFSPELFVILGVQRETFAPTFENLHTLLDARTRQRLDARRASLQEAARPFADLYWITRPDGERALLDARGWSVDDGAGAPRQMFGTCRDVTEAATLRDERARLDRRQAMILNAAGEGICGLDLEGRITFTNPALLRLMRREEGGLIGRRLHDLVHRDGDGHQTHAAAECPFGVREPHPVSAADPGFHRGDGSRIEVGYMLVAFHEGCTRGAVVSLRDVTARRAAGRLLQTSLRQVQTLSAQRGALLRHLAEAEERERLRIAADIHDDTIQALGAVALRLSTAGGRVAGDAERDLLAGAEVEVRGVAERLRRLMFELMPPGDGGDLRAAVQTYCEILFAESSMRWEILGDVGALAAERHLVAYRLLQEALRNARAHSHGSRVQVSLRDADGELALRVCDDGVGMADFDAPPTHAGLRIVRQRAEAAGGTARFGPGIEGRGLCIELVLPVRR